MGSWEGRGLGDGDETVMGTDAVMGLDGVTGMGESREQLLGWDRIV